MTDDQTFAEHLTGNAALPGRRQHHARLALGAMGYGRHDMSGAEWVQAQRDARHLEYTHSSRVAARYRVCPPLPTPGDEA